MNKPQSAVGLQPAALLMARWACSRTETQTKWLENARDVEEKRKRKKELPHIDKVWVSSEMKRRGGRRGNDKVRECEHFDRSREEPQCCCAPQSTATPNKRQRRNRGGP